VKVFEDDGTEVPVASIPGPELEVWVNQDLAAFNDFFQSKVGDSPLIGPEVAMLKTYIWWKTHSTAASTMEDRHETPSS